MIFHVTTVVLIDHLAIDHFEDAVRDNVDVFGMQGDGGREVSEGIGTRLQDTPQLALFKVFILFFASKYFFF
jgi:hypothetical protein